MELRILFKNTIYLMVTRVVKFAVGFIRAKLVAIYLGTLGAGIISQLDQLTSALTQFTMLSMNDGLVKEIAESNKDDIGFKQKLACLIKSYIIMISIILISVFAISIYFSKEITVYFLGNIKYYGYFLIGLASFPVLVINSISYAILKSFKQIKYLARSELIVLVINILIFIPLIFIWGLSGAVIYIVFAFITILIVNHYYAQKIVLSKIEISLMDILTAKISRKAINELFLFAGYGLTAGIAATLAEIITRAMVVTKLGINQIGIYSPVIIWSSLFTGFILPSIGTYLYPRYCECKSDLELDGVINDSLRFVTLLMIPILLISIPIRFQIITIFYSKDFIDSGNYLPWHFLGTLFFLWMYVFLQAMKPTGRIKTEGIVTIIGCILDLAIVYYLVSLIGLYGFMLKFLISPIIIFTYYMFYWKGQIHFKLEIRNFIIMGYAVLSTLMLILIEKFIKTNYKINIIIGLTLLGIAFLMLDKSEKNIILKKIKIR
jgi:O-antigen/teichoic acid export membrane protein